VDTIADYREKYRAASEVSLQFKQQIAELTDQMNALADLKDELQEKLDAKPIDFASENEEIASLRAQMAEKVRQLQQARKEAELLKEWVTDLGAVHGENTSLKAQVEQDKTDFDVVNERVISLTALVREQEDSIGALEAEVEYGQEQSAENEAKIASKRDEINALTEKHKLNLTTKQEELDTVVATKQEELEDILATKQEELDTLLATKQEELDTLLATKHEEFGVLENALVASQETATKKNDAYAKLAAAHKQLKKKSKKFKRNMRNKQSKLTAVLESERARNLQQAEQDELNFATKQAELTALLETEKERSLQQSEQNELNLSNKQAELTALENDLVSSQQVIDKKNVEYSQLVKKFKASRRRSHKFKRNMQKKQKVIVVLEEELRVSQDTIKSKTDEFLALEWEYLNERERSEEHQQVISIKEIELVALADDLYLSQQVISDKTDEFVRLEAKYTEANLQSEQYRLEITYKREEITDLEADIRGHKQTIAEKIAIIELRDQALVKAHRKIDGMGTEVMAIETRRVRIQREAATTHYNLGVVFMQQQHLSKALSEYKLSLDLNNGDPYTHYNMALIYDMQGRPEFAVQHYEAYLALLPNASDAQEVRGLLSQTRLRKRVGVEKQMRESH